MRRRFSSPKTMSAKYAGTCVTCNGAIKVGQIIKYANKQAWHVDCKTAAYTASQCTCCRGSGMLWNNAPCSMCDGTGSREVQDFAKSGGHKLYYDDPGYIEGGNYVD